jgi:hypothetical protein
MPNMAVAASSRPPLVSPARRRGRTAPAPLLVPRCSRAGAGAAARKRQPGAPSATGRSCHASAGSPARRSSAATPHARRHIRGGLQASRPSEPAIAATDDGFPLAFQLACPERTVKCGSQDATVWKPLAARLCVIHSPTSFAAGNCCFRLPTGAASARTGLLLVPHIDAR